MLCLKCQPTITVDDSLSNRYHDLAAHTQRLCGAPLGFGLDSTNVCCAKHYTAAQNGGYHSPARANAAVADRAPADSRVHCEQVQALLAFIKGHCPCNAADSVADADISRRTLYVYAIPCV